MVISSPHPQPSHQNGRQSIYCKVNVYKSKNVPQQLPLPVGLSEGPLPTQCSEINKDEIPNADSNRAVRVPMRTGKIHCYSGSETHTQFILNNVKAKPKHKGHENINVGCVYVCMLLQSCATLCGSWTGMQPARLHGNVQARILEWAAMPSSRGSSQPRDRTHISYISFIDRWVLYHQHLLGSPPSTMQLPNKL